MVWMIIGVLTAVCTLIALIHGLIGVHVLEFSIDLVTGKTANFEIGVSNEYFTDDDNSCTEQELRIGLLFATVIIVFIKFKA